MKIKSSDHARMKTYKKVKISLFQSDFLSITKLSDDLIVKGEEKGEIQYKINCERNKRWENRNQTTRERVLLNNVTFNSIYKA